MTDIRRLPGPTVDKWEWQLLGACRGEDSGLFFHPEGERGPRRARREAAAKAVCARCPVVAECLAHSLATHEPYGVWGGLSESEREALLVARGEKSAGRAAGTVADVPGLAAVPSARSGAPAPAVPGGAVPGGAAAAGTAAERLPA